MKKFNIPIAIFIFKREEKAIEIINRISKIKPSKIYLIGDGGRNKEEHEIILNTRRKIENAIDWKCEIIKNYSDSNRGVYKNIALGAKWVFQYEEKAIFLEDDNLPELTFFKYCRDLLEMYKNNNEILYVCGTNYLGKYFPKDGSDYVFTQHMLPCGWASWRGKFLKYYDGELDLYNEDNIRKIRKTYQSEKMYNYDLDRINH